MWLVSNTCRSQRIKHVSGQEPTSFNSNHCVLALVNSVMSPAETHKYLNETRECHSTPVSTTFTGLLCLLVGAQVHHVRSDTGKCRMWPPLFMHHFQCMTIIGIPGRVPTEAM